MILRVLGILGWLWFLPLAFHFYFYRRITRAQIALWRQAWLEEFCKNNNLRPEQVVDITLEAVLRKGTH
jgi:hypothetical protein